MTELNGQVALITGSTRGIGESTARMLAAHGASVSVTGRNAERGESVAKDIEADGGDAIFTATDVGVEEDVRRAVQATVERFGRLDILVNNAAPTDVMAGQTGRLDDVAWDEFEDVMRVGLYGAVWATRFAVPYMQQAGGGSIINISSLAAVQGLPGLASYTCAKGALLSLTRQLAVDYAPDAIRVNCLVLGVIINELTGAVMSAPGLGDAMERLHLTRLGENDDVARMVTYLAGEDGGFLTGQEIRIDGGVSIKGALVTDMVETGLGADTSGGDSL